MHILGIMYLCFHIKHVPVLDMINFTEFTEFTELKTQFGPEMQSNSNFKTSEKQ